MRASDIRPSDPIRYGAYFCLTAPPDGWSAVAAAGLPELAERLGLRNEYYAEDGDPAESIAYLRRVAAEPGQIADPGLEDAHAIVHVAAGRPDVIDAFRDELANLIDPAAGLRVLPGVVRPLRYTSAAMFNFAYGHRILQQPASAMANAFLAPVRKTAAWWEKDWMERHTYFLPRYDDSGQMISQGHALASAAGISCLLRRTYKSQVEPAGDGDYDFISYFECADADVPVFHEVCAALRDTDANPEWKFVREGPVWHGRRTASWQDLFA